MKCKEEGCEGLVDENNPVPIQTGCHSNSSVYPCEECGRLHWFNGSPVFKGVYAGKDLKAFLEDNKVVLKEDENNQLVRTL